MKTLLLALCIVTLTGCATRVNEYQIYAEQTAKIVAATNASEAACYLVVAEGVKSSDASTKTAIATQIDRCKKPVPTIQAPRKSWLGL